LIVSDDSAEILSNAELKESLTMIERGEADMKSGRVQDMRQALLETGSKRGFTLDE